MPQFSLRLPEDLRKKAAVLAQEQGVSLNQFFLYAITTVVAGLEARSFFEQRRGSIPKDKATAAALQVLNKIPARKPLQDDEHCAADGTAQPADAVGDDDR
jgi:hypothetical protein